ncbi:aminomethyl-transferring glycine dehydrogenase subunit GcvPB [bacterium]|nr:aminomethyl-transferring glycine dehydrogenase subunit GcvPB [bacterium]
MQPNQSKLIFEYDVENRHGTQVVGGMRSGRLEDHPRRLPQKLLRQEPLPLPQVGELELTRHYVKLAQDSFGIDTGFYPLGSCTMKYNPKACERYVKHPGFANTHPQQPVESLPGFLQIFADLQDWLADITGMDRISLTPAAGAQGEFAGMLIFKRYFESRGEHQRTVMIVPDSAHGTNPASAVLSGFEVAEVKCADADGIMNMEILNQAIEKHGAERIAGIMLTNPSTLGTFEKDILAVSERMHEIGALLYYDGANLNALLGIARPGDMGFDLIHINTHKTLSTPHGGGGPGSGPIGVKEHLAPFLPHPHVRTTENGHEFYRPEQSIGRMKLFHGQFGILVRAWLYILLHGPDGLKRISENAIINANYLQARLKEHYPVRYDKWSDGRDRYCMHEFVASCGRLKKEVGVSARDIAKALLNAGYHAPTTYFPLIIEEALMIEPTETESKELLDAFADVMLDLHRQARVDADSLRELPNLSIKNLDETYAARHIDVRWQPQEQAGRSSAG